MKRYSQIFLHWVLRLLGPALLLYFILNLDLRRVGDILGGMHIWWFVLSCVLIVPFLVFKGLRWKLILDAWKMDLSLVDATALYSVGVFLGVVTPGQAGDAVKAWYLRRRGYPLASGLLSVIVDRFFDVAIMGALAATGIFYYRSFLPARFQWLLAAALVGVMLGLFVLGSRQLRRWLLHTIAPLIVPRRLRELAARSSLSGRTLHIRPARLALVGLVSAIGLGFTFLRLYMLFIALDVSMPVGPYVAMIAIIAIVQTFSVAGIGIRDAVMIAILGQYGISAEFAFSLSTLFLLLNALNVLVGFLVSLRYPLADLRRPVEEEPLHL